MCQDCIEERASLPEVQAYQHELDLARTAYHDEYVEARGISDWTQRTEQIDKVIETYEAAHQTAWNALKTSRHALVAWIATTLSPDDGYETESGEILRFLTEITTLHDLDAFAERQGYCDAWTHYRSMAVAAGLFNPDGTIKSAESTPRPNNAPAGQEEVTEP